MAEGDSFNITLPNVNTVELLSMFEGESLTSLFSGESGNEAELEILEQPKQRGFRFRYSCEGPSHGGLPGENSQKGKKSYPSVQINGYCGKARIEVSLVTASDPPKPHAHSLVGKDVVNGACVVEVSPSCGMTASFQNLGIQHVTKKNVRSVLKERHLRTIQLERSVSLGGTASNQSQAMNVDIGSTAGPSREATDTNIAESITREEMAKIDQVVEYEAKNMNLSTVRLCFQTYLPDDQGHFVRCLRPVYSHQIYDSKAAASSELRICRVDKQSGFVQGGEEIFLLCDKVQKDDIEVRFFEHQENREEWEAFGKFSPSDVHRQFAIVFKTPEYWNHAIEKPVTVKVELRRKSDKETSPPIEFTYKPTEFDPEMIGAKRRKKVPHFSEFEQASGSDQGAGLSGTDVGAGMPQFFNPNIFGPLGGLPAMTFSGLGIPGTGLLGSPFHSGVLPAPFGATGGDGTSQLYQAPDDEPSQSNMP